MLKKLVFATELSDLCMIYLLIETLFISFIL